MSGILSAPRYQIPTHLNVPDTIDIPLLGITISLTMRQGVIFLFGWSMAFAWWHGTVSWEIIGVLPLALHWVLPGSLALAVFLVAMLQLQGRSCEQWLVIVLRYLISEKVFVWRSVASEHLQAQENERYLCEERGKENGSTDLFPLMWYENEGIDAGTDREREQS